MKMIDVVEISKYYKSISDVTRLKILKILLTKNECICICDLADEIGKNQSVIYKHVQILKQSNLINTRKDDKYLMCCIEDKKKVEKIFELNV